MNEVIVLVKWYTHILVGVGFSLYMLSPRPYYINETVVFAILGSIVPDLDIKYNHRTLLHNIFTLLLTSMLLAIILLLHLKIPFEPTKYITTSYSIAYALHILLDTLTIKGVKLFWPFSRSSISISRMKYDDLKLNISLSTIGILLLVVYVLR